VGDDDEEDDDPSSPQLEELQAFLLSCHVLLTTIRWLLEIWWLMKRMMMILPPPQLEKLQAFLLS
jgi:hypothetical protein